MATTTSSSTCLHHDRPRSPAPCSHGVDSKSTFSLSPLSSNRGSPPPAAVSSSQSSGATSGAGDTFEATTTKNSPNRPWIPRTIESKTPSPEAPRAASRTGLAESDKSLRTPSPFLSRPKTCSRSASVSKSKLRRKVSVPDTLAESTAVQRLVEYFVVVSSHPRWDSTRLATTPEAVQETQSHSAPSPPASPSPSLSPEERDVGSPSLDASNCQKITPRFRLRSTKRNCFNKFDDDSASGEDNGDDHHADDHDNTVDRLDRLDNDLDEDLDDDDSSRPPKLSEKVLPPTPRNEWTREETEAENIHLPEIETNIEHENTFQPKVTARFPLKDHKDNPLNPMIDKFCFPSGDVIVPSRTYEMPRVHHFVLTNDKGRKVYGTCLTVYEEYQQSPGTPWRKDQIHSDDGEHDIEVTVGNQETTSLLYIPKVLCLLSTWPYLTAFREYLSQLYRLAAMTNIMTTPIERYVLNICMEIPAPPPGAYEVQLSILDSTIRFWAPPAKLPVAYVALPYGTLFDCLDVENILLLWNALLMENKVLLLSSQYSLLAACAEILCSLLFPMRWCHLYVPLLPRFLCPMLDAPVPYLCGVNRENWLFAQQHISTETIVVDLDRNTVAFGQYTPQLTPAPTRKWTKLQAAVEQTAGHLFWRTRGLEDDYRSLQGRKPLSRRNLARLQKKGKDSWNEKLQSYDDAYNLAYTPDSPNLLNGNSLEYQQSEWDRVQEAFLRFFVALLKDYRKFLNKPEADTPGNFDTEAFIASQRPDTQPFLADLSTTQQFDDYMTKRLYSPGEPDVVFFDQSIDAKLNRSRLKLKKVDTPFLQSAKAHKVLKKFQAVQPSSEGLLDNQEPTTPLVYKTWPSTFNTQLFCEPRPIPKMITAEFDRQSVLVSRLRAQFAREESDDILFDLYGDECSDTPEGAAFTVFFYAYSALIGRDWLEYQNKRREQQLELEAKEAKDQEQPLDDIVVTHTEEESYLTPYKFPAFEITKEDCGVDVLCEACPNEGLSTLKSTLYMVNSVTPNVKNIFRFDNARFDNAMNTMKSAMSFPLSNGPNREMSLVDFEDSYFAEYEEARAVASAQLDLAFETLSTMTLRGLSTDADAYKSLMEACGRCGDTHRALELIDLMKRDGLCADGEVLSCFMSAFAHQEDRACAGLSPANRGLVKSPYHKCDAYYAYLKKKLEVSEQTQAGLASSSCLSGLLSSDDEAFSDYTSENSDLSTLSEGENTANTTSNSSFMEWLTPHKIQKARRKRSRRRRRRRGKVSTPDMPVTDVVENQINLGESLLEFLYSGLSIDTTSDSCPHCSHVMNENEIVAGWLPCAFEDFTTCCTKCQHRFVPRFTVTCLSPTFQGSQGMGTPLYCEFLSPWVLRKELRHVAKGSSIGIEEMLSPDWRSGSDIRGTLWWNMIVLCRRYKLPFSFLLQGSFQNRLINPTPANA